MFYHFTIERKDAEYREYISENYTDRKKMCDKIFEMKDAICTLCCYTNEQFWETFTVAIFDSSMNRYIYITDMITE